MIGAAVINKLTNRVVNIIACESKERIPQEDTSFRYEELNMDIHPWGQEGAIDVEPGLGWREKYVPTVVEPEIAEEAQTT